MYSLDVNFLKDRYSKEEIKPSPQESRRGIDLGKQFPLIAGAVVMVLLPSFAWGWLMTINNQKAQVEQEIKQLDGQIKRVNAQQQKIKQLNQQLAQANKVPNAIVSVLNQVKPMSAILQDLRELIPDRVEISSIKQSKPIPPGENADFSTIKLTLSGEASSYDEANDFLLTLQQSDFVKAGATTLTTAKETESNIEWVDPNIPKLLEKENITIEFPNIVDYTIETELNQVPASQLIRTLENRGAVGLVTWIRTLETQGVEQP
jgi:type IV pilus assembly protein PilN